MREWNGKRVITMDDWTGMFEDIAKKGDLIEKEVVDFFLNCVPPASMRSYCMQCGEPHSHKEDCVTGNLRATFVTFKQITTTGIYEYCGHCFCGENIERE